jgi:hypothetical protein
MCHSCIPPKMRWLLKAPFDQNSILINHKPNDNFEGRFIYREIHERLLALLITSSMVILKATSFLKGHKSNKKLTDNITLSYMTYVLIALNPFIKGKKNLFEATFRFAQIFISWRFYIDPYAFIL